ncbi:alpha/beta fold hydrolase [candidate division WWE3 bacterium]|uniref:Alpha/beta fold hydrolase n=1 Tax=candidate division WWE3 bacterium TaxID=2053526 RepID=A0A955J1T9_UNCKA|nr:alpha/beta fold hydrolase [candidate division WWE3 bacterium]
MRYIVLALVVGLLIAGYIYYSNEKSKVERYPTNISVEKENMEFKKNTQNIQEEYKEGTIPWLKQQTYNPQKLQIENTITSNSDFTSYKVSYKSQDNISIYALMHIPAGDVPQGGWPILIFNHGYIPPEQYSTESSYKDYSESYARKGFIVIKSDYRGHDKSEGKANNSLGRIDYAMDVLNLMETLPSIENANLDKIFMYGHSMGGEVSLVAAEVNNKVKGISLWAPAVKEFPENPAFFLRRPENVARLSEFELALETVPPKDYPMYGAITNLDKLEAPIILHHGTLDESVPYQWAIDLEKELIQADKSVQFYTYQNDNHNLTASFTTVVERDVEFFNSL